MKKNENRSISWIKSLLAGMLSVFLVLTLLSAVSHAVDAFDIEINANQSELEGRIGIRHPVLSETLLSTGLGVVSSDEKEYTVGGLDLSFGSESIIRGLHLGIGFKGIFGRAEKKRRESGMLALAFLVSMVYDIPEIEIYDGIPLDFEFSATVDTAPEPLSFGDSDSYLDFKTALGLNVLGKKRGAVLVGYRSIQAEFHKEERNEWEMSESSWFVGYKFRF